MLNRRSTFLFALLSLTAAVSLLFVTPSFARGGLIPSGQVFVEHGDNPSGGGIDGKYRKVKSNAKEIGADKIQVTSKNGSNSESDEELLP
ncbi:MAG: hypothetical protein COA70_03690 [Planctomycetota bacterium]|nr:MAG: hypothetical protein COA70_03690 [Planctomycetota bacterium]